MATATALDPITELEQQVEKLKGVAPLVTVAADDTALVSYRLAGEVRTQVWLRGEGGWSMFGTDSIAV